MISLNSPDIEKRTEFIPEHACSHHFEYQEKKKNKLNTQQRMKGENGIKEKKQAKDIGTLDFSTAHITLKVHFVQSQSVSFSSSVLVLNTVAPSEISK